MFTLADKQIREALHRKKLCRHYYAPDTLVVDELGLMHGKYRADIAVINGHLIGYEIKSDEDTLYRLPEQVKAYCDVFDRVTVVVGMKHADVVSNIVPDWWGIVVVRRGNRGGILFESSRTGQINRDVNLFSIAQLLWKNEVSSILAEFGVPSKTLRQRRSELYRMLVELLNPIDLRHYVRECLRSRKTWRYHPQPSGCDGLCQPFAM
jgi:hypothetical protein